MKDKISHWLMAVWRRLVAGLTGLLMLIVPGGDRTVTRYMLRSFGGVAGGSVLLSLLLLTPGSESMASFKGLLLLLLILGGFSLLAGWFFGILRARTCPDCKRPMGTASFGGQGMIPDYGCDACDKDFAVRDLASRDCEERRLEAHRLLQECYRTHSLA